MNTAVIHEALFLVALFSFVPLCASAVIGLCVSLLQAVTQIQEQTTPFIIKLVSFGIILFFFGNIAAQEIVHFTQMVLLEIK